MLFYAWQETIVDESGNVRPNAFVEVRNADTLELVDIYEDRLGITPRTNPFRARAGFARFWAPAGRYEITALDDELERSWFNVRLGVTSEDLPDLTAALTAIVNTTLTPAVEAYQAQLLARDPLRFFTIETDGSSADIPDGWSSSRLSAGRYRVTHRGGSTDYAVKLTVWDTSSDRVQTAALLDLTADYFEIGVRSIHDEASSNDARVAVEVTGTIDPPPFPYTFLAIRTDGRVMTSMTGLDGSWSDGGYIEGALNSRTWRYAVYIPPLNRVLVVAQQAHSANNMRRARTDDGVTWTHGAASCPGLAGFPTKLIWTDTWGGANGRVYCAVRQNGGSQGDIYFSDDGGDTWTAVTWPVAKSGQWNIEYLGISPTRIVCMGRFFTDGNTTKRIFYSTDGVNFVAGATGITSSGLVDAGDGHTRACCWSPTFGAFFFVGASGSSFSPPTWTSTVDGTTATAPVNMPVANAARSYDLQEVGSGLVCSFILGGTTGTWFALYNGSSWSNIPETGPPDFENTAQLANSPSAGTLVSGANNGDLGFSTNQGADWDNAVPVQDANWHAVVATA